MIGSYHWMMGGMISVVATSSGLGHCDCGGGIAASSNAFIMTRLGYTDVAVYTASLQEWAADPANPLVVD